MYKRIRQKLSLNNLRRSSHLNDVTLKLQRIVSRRNLKALGHTGQKIACGTVTNLLSKFTRRLRLQALAQVLSRNWKKQRSEIGERRAPFAEHVLIA